MSSLKCCYLNNIDSSCLYNMGCNNFNKTNQVRYPCPAKFEDKFNGCTLNSNNITCPVYICNNSNQDNNYIVNHNLPNKDVPVTFPHRGKYKLCNKYIDLNENNIQKIKIKEPYIGKLPIKHYFDNIEKESKLLNLNYKNTKCFNEFSKNLHIKENNDYQSSLLKDNNIKRCSISKPKQKINKYICKNQINSYNQTRLLEFNYKNDGNIPCNTGCLPKSKQYIEDKNLIFSQLGTDMMNQPILQIGPERTNQTTENIWNNLVNRKYIM